MSWQTGTATTHLDLLDKLIKTATGNHAVSATIGAGGTGYTVGDILTVAGGTFTFAATLKVVTAPAGVISAVSVVNGGAYTVNPTNPASVTGGTGSSATFNLTMAATGWTTMLDNAPGEREVILKGTGGGSDSIYAGFKTFTLTAQDGFSSSKNWGVVAMTGFNSLLLFHEQPGISPGFDASGVASTVGGAFVPLKPSDAFPILFWFSITPYRIIMVARVEDATHRHYVSCYVGFMNRFGTSSEFPYPIYVAGSSSRRNTFYLDTQLRITGLAQCMGILGLEGPAFYRTSDSLWLDVKNSEANDAAGTRAAHKDYTVYPVGQTTIEGAVEDQIVVDGGGFTWDDIIPVTGNPGTQTYKLQRTPMTGGDLFLLVPCTIVASEDDNGRNDVGVLGEIDDVFWFDSISPVAAEDSITFGGNIYRVFPNGNQSNEFNYMAIKEG